MLVTLTPRLRIHQNEVVCSLVKGNTVILRFVSMKPMRISIDDLTEEARHWLLPSLAPREIPIEDESEYEDAETEEVEVEEEDSEHGRPGPITGHG